MQHWPFCLSPETPPPEDAAQHSQNRGIIRPQHSNFSLPPQCRAMAQISAQEWDGGCKSDRSVGGQILASAWLVQHAHVPGKTAPTNFKRALVLGQFAQPSPARYPHIASSQEHELSSSCSFYWEPDLDVDDIDWRDTARQIFDQREFDIGGERASTGQIAIQPSIGAKLCR
jgi:hypothetical protein